MGRAMDVNRDGKLFTRNWFRNRNLSTFRDFVYPVWSGQPHTTYLELGVFEGMSLTWMFQYVLTDSTSRAVCVDPWLDTIRLSNEYMDEVRQRAYNNLDEWKQRCHIHRGTSAVALRRILGRHGYLGLTRDSVDICMVDGEHNALAVLDDLRLVSQIVKPDGWIILDDVVMKHQTDNVDEGRTLWLQELRLQGRESQFRLLWKDRHCECYKRFV